MCGYSNINPDINYFTKMNYEEELLNLEEKFYQEGYQEGHEKNLQENFLEGKQFGLQVGFQRFIFLGQVIGVCDVIDSLSLDNTLIDNSIKSLRKWIGNVGMDNDDENVENLEKTLVKIKNKFRTLLLAVQKNTKSKGLQTANFDDIEKVTQIIAGELKSFTEDEEVSEAKNTQDQMHDW